MKNAFVFRQGLSGLSAVLALTATSMASLPGQKSPRLTSDQMAITTQMGKLRKMPELERSIATRELARQIQRLSPSPGKEQLALGLSNLATEGDCGKEVLQEVATTLAESTKETPLDAAYGRLAELAHYEHVKIRLQSPAYEAAMKAVLKLAKTREATNFSLTDLDGHPWTLSSLKGKVVLVNFWATWCPPCRAEMPAMEKLYHEFKDKGLVILAISDEDASKVSPFISQHKYSYPILLDPGDSVEKRYQLDGIPHTFVYNQAGKLVAEGIDGRTEGQFRALLGRAGLR